LTESLKPADGYVLPRDQKVLASVVIVGGLTLVGLIVWGVLALGNAISPPVFQTSTSPGGTWIIEVRKAGVADSDSGTLLITVKRNGEEHGQEVLRLDSAVGDLVQWQDEDHLQIEWESDSAVSVGGARVTLPPPPGEGC
jgi:hypothetical protein